MTARAEPLDFELNDDVAWFILNRPSASNAINLELAHAFHRGVVQAKEAKSRVVVIYGANGKFSAGGDVREMAAADDLPAYIRELVGTLHDALADLAELDAVIIAAVDGVAAGGGLGIALAADILFASDRAMFVTAYEAVSLAPDSGTSYLLPRVVGLSRARAMSAAGARMDATTAASIGLVHEVVPAQALLQSVTTLADRLAAKPQGHMSATRQLYFSEEPGGYRRHLDAEARAISAASASADAQRLIEQFAQRSVSGSPRT